MGLGVILNLTRQQDDAQLARSVSGILEHMFKHTEETSVHLISNGALDALLYWCRGTDPTVLRHCAVALANCAMYGGHRCQRCMIEKQAAEWLFPLAFSKEDELIRFHACLAVTVLAANKEIEEEVVKSGTLELVEPFITSLDPDDFARSLLDSADCMQGKTASDLRHFMPLLDGTRLEGICIAAFYLCVETSIKSRQRNTKVQPLSLLHRAQDVVCELCFHCGSNLFSFPDISGDWGSAEPKKNRHVLQQWHSVRPGQAGAEHDGRGSAETHAGVCAQLENL